MTDKKNISMGVKMTPLVESKKDAIVGEKIVLKLISGLRPEEVEWSNGNDLIKSDIDSTVIFNKTGTYRLIVKGYPQHESYSIKVS